MKLDTAGLQAFVAIVEQGTFQKAGVALNLSQTGLSRRLQQLEKQLGVRLIDRTTRSWSLTPVGASFLPKARKLVHDLEFAMAEVRDAARYSRGAVTISCVVTAALHLLPDILLRYSKRFPDNHVRILDAAAPEVTEAVLERRAEFGINVLTRRYGDLDAVTLKQDPFVLMCRDDHPLAEHARVRWETLAKQDVIVLGRGSGNEVILDAALTQLALGLHGRYEAQRPSTALGLVAAGAGAAALPSMTLKKGTYPRIRAIPLVEPVVYRELALIKRRDAALAPAAEKLYAMVAETFRGGR